MELIFFAGLGTLTWAAGLRFVCSLFSLAVAPARYFVIAATLMTVSIIVHVVDIQAVLGLTLYLSAWLAIRFAMRTDWLSAFILSNLMLSYNAFVEFFLVEAVYKRTDSIANDTLTAATLLALSVILTRVIRARRWGYTFISASAKINFVMYKPRLSVLLPFCAIGFVSTTVGSILYWSDDAELFQYTIGVNLAALLVLLRYLVYVDQDA